MQPQRALLAIALQHVCMVHVRALLRPQSSETRGLQSLSGLWNVKIDPSGEGDAQSWWKEPLRPPHARVPVPATLNEVMSANPSLNYTDGYFGVVWYEREFFTPAERTGANTSAYELYFEAVTANAMVYLNGRRLVSHRGIGLPFAATVEPEAKGGVLSVQRANRLTVRVDGLRNWQDLPPGKATVDQWGEAKLLGGDAGYYYSTPGIDGDVWLTRLAALHVVTSVVTTWNPPNTLTYVLRCDHTSEVEPIESCGLSGAVGARLLDGGAGPAVAESSGAQGALTVKAPRLWWPVGMEQHGTPHLYTLELHTSTDTYRVSVGLRTVKTKGRQLLVNDKPVYVRGVDYHQDAPVRGHAANVAESALDVALMRSVGMNAYRMNSWPSPEITLDLCDREGILVQSEAPGIALRGGWDPACPRDVFNPTGACANATTLQRHKDVMQELVIRDQNRASVVSWSLSNEPETDAKKEPGAVDYFNSLLKYARGLDHQKRPITIEGANNMQFALAVDVDLVSVHNYPGWYDYAPVSRVTGVMAGFLAEWSTAFPNKPMLISEYGAGAIPGHHEQPPTRFTEEFQTELLRADHAAFDLFRLNGTLAGEHVHAFHDFKQTGPTVQDGPSARGMLLDISGLNYKGLFSRDRKPKSAARVIQERYNMIDKSCQSNVSN